MGFLGDTLTSALQILTLDPDRLEAQIAEAVKRLRGGRKTPAVQKADLSRAYQQEKLVLVLGAGVSLEYGLPSWPTLLQELLIRSLGDRNDKDPQRTAALATVYTQAFRPNPLIAARYVRLNLRDGFVKTVREVLYSKVGQAPDTPLMQAIRTFAIAPGRAPNLDSIITFNFDDILERSLTTADVPVNYHVISDVEIKPRANALPIYHVHGFLPREGDIAKELNITLSEDDYHARYTDTYHWSNIVQINKFRENTCLFIGLSFSDPNLRRLLDIAQRQRGGSDEAQHFLVRKRYSVQEAQATLDAIATEAPPAEAAAANPTEGAARQSLAQSVVDLMERIDERDAASFGVSIIWVNGFSEVPTLLREIYSQTVSPAERGAGVSAAPASR